MDSELLSALYHRLLGDSKLRHTFGHVYSDGLIVLIHCFAVLTHHSHHWAHDRCNWPLWCRKLTFPSYSQLMKRLALPQVQQVIAQISGEYRLLLLTGEQKVCDAKPLVVGGYSKDKQATRGKVPDGFARGYRLHALIDAQSGAFEAFEVTGLASGEPTVMGHMIEQSELALTGGIIRADSNYDSNSLYQIVASHGARLIAPRKKPHTGLGHGKSGHHPHRLQAIAELEDDPAKLKEHRRQRNCIEQRLAHLTNVSFGLWALPNFVRTLKHVQQWVATKLMLYHLFLALARKHAAEAA